MNEQDFMKKRAEERKLADAKQARMDLWTKKCKAQAHKAKKKPAVQSHRPTSCVGAPNTSMGARMARTDELVNKPKK